MNYIIRYYSQRDWGQNIFRSEQECEKNPQITKVNPGKNINNLAEKFNLDFYRKQ